MLRPPWTNYLGINKAEDEEVGKLLGASFSLSLTSGDIDSFLYDKISKKLDYWSTQKINPTGRAVVVNSMLLSTMLFFLSIWGGARTKGLKKPRVWSCTILQRELCKELEYVLVGYNAVNQEKNEDQPRKCHDLPDG